MMMNKAAREFEADVLRIFSELEGATLPTAQVESIYSYGIAEDGETLMVMVDLADGSTAAISVAPGQPIGVRVVIEPPALKLVTTRGVVDLLGTCPR
ncbi:MAG: hypothetical protein HY661_03795 [Betaproteobacteria bacterium]|nr:hypothetical protein [Betaproteobacteria bacterium]